MRCPPVMADEIGRLRALAEYGLNADRPLPSLDPVVELATQLFDMPAAAVNLIGSDHVFFASSAGIGDCDMRREVSFCAHAITQDEVLIIDDALRDERFHDNPLVVGNLIRFYAGVPLRAPNGHAIGALCVVDAKPHSRFSEADQERLKHLAKIVSDKLELRRLEVAGEAGRGRFENIAISSPDAIVCFQASRTISAVNPAAEAMFGHTASEMIGEDLQNLFPAWRDSQIAALLLQNLDSSEITEDLLGQHRDGTRFPVELAWSSWLEGDTRNFGLVIRKVSARRDKSELDRLAQWDIATGLPNRVLLEQRAAEERDAGRPLAMLAIGLEGHSAMKAALGLGQSDELLRQAGKRISDCIRPIDTVARLGGDEFAILLSGIGDPLRAMDVASAALAVLSEPFEVNGEQVRLAGGCGIALSSIQAQSDELVGNAHLALLEARKLGAARPQLFTPALRMNAVARLMFDADLHRAVERGEFELYYQPLARIGDHTLCGAEALIRWNHPERGLLSPAAFLPFLESSPLAATVGEWVIETACGQAAAWRSELWPEFRISVNLSAAQFRRGDLRDVIKHAIRRHGMPAEALKLEITETIVLDDEELFLPVLKQLREDGHKLAFDDFGTGFASLSLLTRYPLTHLKIDKSFVQAACGSEGDRAIVEAIADLARHFRLEVVAEGVETQEQFELCRAAGCDEIQGYFLGRPLNATDFVAMAGDVANVSSPNAR